MRTGVIVTADELERVKAQADAPAIALHCGPAPSALQSVQELARAHGLPNVTGSYGMDLETGELLAPS